MLASVMCSEWEDVAEYDLPESVEGTVVSQKTLSLGTSRNVWQVIKKYAQTPVEYQLFKSIQFNQLSIEFALNSFVKMTWDILGGNHPKSQTDDPVKKMTGVDYGTALTTKSFKTLEGYIKVGDSLSNLIALRQVPNLSITINNNKERTDALFETEAIEMSDGDFNVSGTLEVWKAGNIARELSNGGIGGEQKCFEVQVSRKWYDTDSEKYMKTMYTIQLKVHLDDSQESKDGNKLKNSIPFTMNSADGIKFIKTIVEVDE